MAAQVIAEVTLDRDGDDDYARKLDQLRREEELIVEENKEAAALLQADIPIIQPGQVCLACDFWQSWKPPIRSACCEGL